MYIVFHVEGGIGKNIAATAVIKAIKRTYHDSKIVVVCSWPEVFSRNPDIYRVYRYGITPYFYEDYIKPDTLVFRHEPYFCTNHILGKQHLIKTWCEMYDLQYENDLPSLYFNYRERETSQKLIQLNEKPILVFQPFGGPGKENNPLPYSWTRDLHPSFAQQVVDHLAPNYNVVQISYDHHPSLQNCQVFKATVLKKQLFALLCYAQKRILIDSSLQHAAAAMNLPSTVCWVMTKPELFGYDMHRNIVANKQGMTELLADSYLFDYSFNGAIHECPFIDPFSMFNINEVIL